MGTVGATSLTIDRFVDPLPIPGVVQATSKAKGIDYYEISMDEFGQQVLSNAGATAGMLTTVWGYNGTFPGPTIEARPGRQVSVKWINNLGTDHLLNVDHRVHGAEDTRPDVRNVTHLHGAVAAPEDDGYPDAWRASDGVTVDGNSPVPYKQEKDYPNEQEPTTLWYHDHAIGITRLNVYAGLAAFYLLRDNFENSLPSGMYEVPIVIQDRSFNADGSLYYAEEFAPEFWGDIPVVNGKTYPFLDVEPRKYRFRVLNGSNGRSFNMNLRNDTAGGGGVPLMEQIGVDLGFMDAPVSIGAGGDVPSLTLNGAERADLIVDFSGFEGQTFTLTNDAEVPYTGANSGVIDSISELMQFRVGTTVTEVDDTIPLTRFLTQIRKRYPRSTAQPVTTRYMSLDTGEHNGLDTHFLNESLWADPAAVETVTLDTAEDWVLANTTGDAHPIHLHLVDFDIVKRQNFDVAGYFAAKGGGATREAAIMANLGTDRPLLANEHGPKDTVSVYPGEAVTIRPSFTDFAGRYVWHCHILEHEDQEMMLPYVVADQQA